MLNSELLERQLSEYGRQLDSQIVTLEPADVHQLAPKPPVRRAWPIAVAAAAATLLLVGLIPLLGSNDDSPTGAIVAEPFLVGMDGHNYLVYDPAGWLVVTGGPEGPIVKVEILPDGSAGEVDVVPSSGFEDLSYLAVDDNGVLYFNNYAHQHRTGPGLEPPYWRTPIATGGAFVKPGGLSVDSNGDLYVADRFGSGTRITRIELPGEGGVGTATEVVTVPGEVPEGWRANDIEFGPTGELFVLNYVDEVWAVTFAADGSMASLRLFANIPGNPEALAFDASGTLYVGTETGAVWSVEPAEEPSMVATGCEGIRSWAVDVAGTLFLVEGDRLLRVRTR